MIDDQGYPESDEEFYFTYAVPNGCQDDEFVNCSAETNIGMEDEMNAGSDLKVKVDRKNVLAKVKENRDKHKKDYAEALEGWLDELKKETARAAREAKKITLERALDEGANTVLTDVRVHLTPPRQYLNEYDQVIGLLEVCVEEHLTLTGLQINAWCHDRWTWKDDFHNSNALYMSKG